MSEEDSVGGTSSFGKGTLSAEDDDDDGTVYRAKKKKKKVDVSGGEQHVLGAIEKVIIFLSYHLRWILHTLFLPIYRILN